MEQKVIESLLIFFLVGILSCTSKEILKSNSLKISANKKIDLLKPCMELPDSQVKDGEAVKYFGTTFRLYREFKTRNFSCNSDIIRIFEHSYSFDTIVNGGRQKLVIRRHTLEENISKANLGDVNFFICHLNETTKLLLTEYRDRFDGEIGDLGRMYFCDSISQRNDCDSIDYFFYYSYFSGGGTTLDGEHKYSISIDNFRNWSNESMSSRMIDKLGVQKEFISSHLK